MSLCRRKLTLATAVLLLSTMLAGCIPPEEPAVDFLTAYIDASIALRQAAEDPDPVTRANAIEALSQTVSVKAAPVFKQALDDEYPTVRFAAAMALGDVQYEPAKTTLQRMAKDKAEDERAEPDKRVLCAVIYALHRLGDMSFTGELGGLLGDPEKEVRANAAMVMGKLGEPSAVFPLRRFLIDEQDTAVQLQIVEALAMLGDSANILRLEAYTKTQFLEDRLVAISAMECVQSPRSVVVLREMFHQRQPPRVRVAAAGALAHLGETNLQAYWFCSRAAKDPQRVLREGYRRKGEGAGVVINSLQRLAVISLGWMNRESAVDILHPLLDSEDGGVRVAAAMSILRLLKAHELALEPSSPKAKTKPTSRPEVQSKPMPTLYTAGGKD